MLHTRRAAAMAAPQGTLGATEHLEAAVAAGTAGLEIAAAADAAAAAAAPFDATDDLGAAAAGEGCSTAAPEQLAAGVGTTLSCSSWKEAAGGDQSTAGQGSAAWGASQLQQLSMGFAQVAGLCGDTATVLAQAVWAAYST
jgi:hypothetical protein